MADWMHAVALLTKCAESREADAAHMDAVAAGPMEPVPSRDELRQSADAARSEAAELRGAIAALKDAPTAEDGWRWVRVAEMLLPRLTEWSDPVQVRVLADDGTRAEIVCRRVCAPTGALPAGPPMPSPDAVRPSVVRHHILHNPWMHAAYTLGKQATAPRPARDDSTEVGDA